MQEQIVGFEVAKLAKEKGFKEYCLNYYFEDGELRENKIVTTNGYYGEEVTFKYEELIENWNDKFLTKKDGSRCFGCSKSNGYFETYSAPSHSILQKWLREKHSIHIEIELTDTTTEFYYQYTIVNSKNREWHDEDMTDQAKSITNWKLKFPTFEEALESGLFEALKLINNENQKTI